MVEEEVYIEQPIGYVKKRHRTQGSMTTFRRTASLSVHTSMFEDFKRSMVKEFEMTDVGLMAYFRGVFKIKRKVESISHKRSMQGRYSKGLR